MTAFTYNSMKLWFMFKILDLWDMLPQGTCSLLVQPILQVQHSSDDEIQKVEGFVFLASSMGYAYSDKDIAWIGALTNKIKGKR